jgi:predicted CxxxxCH...CXXCH cytochrome family protein
MMRFLIITVLLLFIMSGIAGAGPKISENGNKHNFSSSNTAVKYRAVDDGDPRGRQICIFCHTPHHSSGDGPLWNRNAPTGGFKRYSSTTLAIDDAGMIAATEYGQPSGSSRLCLSCHDGVTALGAVFTTPDSNIAFIDGKGGASGVGVTIGYETYSSHHPVSFKYNQSVRNFLTGPPYNKALETLPPTSLDPNVKLDYKERMQCTTCHDPHQDRSTVADITTPFWTSTTYDKVCTSCHKLVSPTYPWKP